MRTDVDELRELLENMHAPDCAALEEEVLTYPDRCTCNVAPAVTLVDRLDVASGNASLDVVELTFEELRHKIEVLEKQLAGGA